MLTFTSEIKFYLINYNINEKQPNSEICTKTEVDYNDDFMKGIIVWNFSRNSRFFILLDYLFRFFYTTENF